MSSTDINCFACFPDNPNPPPYNTPRSLCDKHISRTVSGDPLKTVIDTINSELSRGWLEGAPLQWFFGSLTIETDANKFVRGWTFYIPAIYFAVEDRFGASSWLDFWITDLSLDIEDCQRPIFDELAFNAQNIELTRENFIKWVPHREEAWSVIDQAWRIWAGERLAMEQRDTTGRFWPIGDEVFDWVNPRWPLLEHKEGDLFIQEFAQALRKRLENLGP